MKKEKIIIVGYGGHARVVADMINPERFDLIGYVDKKKKESELKYLGSDTDLEKIQQETGCNNAVIGLGSIGFSTPAREKIYNNLKELGFNLPPIIHKSAVIADDVTIDEGTVVMAGAVINLGTKVGKCSVINTCASVDHDCTINDFVHISPGAVLGGGVKVGRGSYVGLGANVIQYIKIGDNCLIGLGAAAVKDCESGWIYAGVPAKKFKELS